MAEVGVDLSFQVRRFMAADATPEHLAALGAIWQESAEALTKAEVRWRIAPDGKNRWLETLKAWLADADYAIYIAERAGKPIGYAVGMLANNPPGLLPERFGLVTEIAIDAHAKTGRIGRELLDGLREWFRAQGVTHVEARVPYQHPIAQAFWRALGATKIVEQLWLKLK